MKTAGTNGRIGRRGAAAVIAMLCATSVAACSAGGSSPKASKSELTIGLTQGPQNLDPAKDGSGPNIAIRALTYATLTHQAPNGSIQPGLATSWKYVGTGNTSFELTLRHDARFSDGTAVNADAVKQWFEYYSKAGGNAATWLPIKSAEAVDQWTVRLELTAPNPIVPVYLSEQWTPGAVVSPSALKDPSKLAASTDGAGPYVLDASQTVTGDHYTYLPNKYFYDQSQIHFAKITAKVITDPTSMLEAATTGQIQVAVGDATTAASATKSGLSVVEEAAGTVGLVFGDVDGLIAKPLADVRVRQALNYAINRKDITSGLVGRYGTPTSQMQTSDGYTAALDSFYAYDPEKAKALLAAAGYATGFSLKVVSQGSWGTLGDPLVRAVAHDLAAVGVELQITTGATDAQWGQLLTSAKYPAFELVNDSVPTWSMYNTLVTQVAGGLFKAKTSSDLAALWAKATSESDPASDWSTMVREMTDQALFLPVLVAHRVWLTAKNIQGVAFSSHTEYPLATEWSIG